jgi:uncharacterized protein
LVAAIETGEFAAGKEKKALEDWEKKVRAEVAETVKAFLEAKGPAVGLFELPDLANTRATLRATELYLSAIFQWARRWSGGCPRSLCRGENTALVSS